MDEVWKEIPNTDYSVSDQGRVASRKFGGWRVMKSVRHPIGYMVVTLCDGRGGQRNMYVHLLVADAFLGPRPTQNHHVNHKNGVKVDARADNLEWMTQSENMYHSYDALGNKAAHGEALPQSKVTETDVREILRRCATGESQRRVAADYGINQSSVSFIARGKTWRHLS